MSHQALPLTLQHVHERCCVQDPSRPQYRAAALLGALSRGVEAPHNVALAVSCSPDDDDHYLTCRPTARSLRIPLRQTHCTRTIHLRLSLRNRKGSTTGKRLRGQSPKVLETSTRIRMALQRCLSLSSIPQKLATENTKFFQMKRHK